MSISVELLEAKHADAYEAFLLSRAETLVYSSTRYMRMLAELLDCTDATVIAREGEAIVGALPLMACTRDGRRLYNSLPYFGSNGGIIASTHHAEAALAAAYRDLVAQPATIASTVITNPFAGTGAVTFPHTLTDERIAQFTPLPMASEVNLVDAVMARVDGSARRNARKAIREGVVVERDAHAFDSLYAMHHENITSIGGQPKDRRFFDLVSRHFRVGTDFDLYVGRLDGRDVAALLLFYFNQTVEYFTPATDSEFRALQPLAAVLQTAMTDAAARGLRTWNWGGTWLSQSGVYQFKKKWGALERRYHYFTQLNDASLLAQSPAELRAAFPGFYALPFGALHSTPGEGNT